MRLFSLSLCLLLLARVAAFGQQQSLTDGIAVIVNDAIITLQDVYLHSRSGLDLLTAQYRDQPDVLAKKVQDIKADATEQLVERQLILADFKSAGFNLPETIIEDTIQERIKQQYGDRITLMQTLKAQNITYESFRQQRHDEIIIEVMRRKNVPTPDIVISPQRVLAFYEEYKTNYAVGEQVKLRMIFLNKAGSDGEAVKQRAADIVRKLDEGVPFKEMAKMYSEGTQRATEGDSGWAERSTLRPELADVAFKLKKGERSGVIDLNDSCWILLVEDVRPARVRPLPEVQDEIERNLRQLEAERLRKKWVARLKDKSFVRYY